MIKETHVMITMMGNIIDYYRNKGYKCKFRDKINIKISDISPNSNIKITACCEKCNKEKLKNYSEYFKIKEKSGRYLCQKCNRVLAKETNIKKYGVDNPMKNKDIKDKLFETNIKKYGNKCTLQNDTIKEKTKTTLLNKHGVDNIAKLKKTQDKISKTNLERYGHTRPLQNIDIYKKLENHFYDKFNEITPLQNKEIKDKIKSTLLEKYGIDNISKLSETKDKISKTKRNKTKDKYKDIIDDYDFISSNIDNDYSLVHLKCGHNFNINKSSFYYRYYNNIICTKCYPMDNNVSNIESNVSEFINENCNSEIILNDRNILNGKELDIYIPDSNIAIEFNGLYWHSELKKEKEYHLNKTLLCKEKNINLIHIFEDDWNYKKDIVKSIIFNRLKRIDNKIYARKCEIREVSSKNTREFLNKNHIQGFSRSKYKLGLYYNDELISLMSFGYRKTNSKKEFELIRFCNSLNVSVIGAASKLFKYFIKNYKIEESYILSYADVSMFNGDLYNRLGFDFIHRTKPNYFWVVNGKKEHRWKYNKQNLIKEGFDSSMTEVEIMHQRGYYRIYGCGQDRYEYRL